MNPFLTGLRRVDTAPEKNSIVCLMNITVYEDGQRTASQPQRNCRNWVCSRSIAAWVRHELTEIALNRKLAYVVVAFAVLLVIQLVPAPEPVDTGTNMIALSSDAKATLAVLAMAVILWMTEAIPFPVTGLLAVVMLVITKAMPFKTLVQDGFGNHIVFFFWVC